MEFQGILFDKDGTLFDFGATWNAWAGAVIQDLSAGDPTRAAALARAVHFDLSSGRFHPDSPVIAGTNDEAAALFHSALPERPVEEIAAFLIRKAADADLVPTAPLSPLLAGLAARGLRLGVMTNDSAYSAHAQLRAAGIFDHFDFVAGFDSGHGAKPAPAPLLAFAAQHGLPPASVVMVGDSTHDLAAGRAAGMATVGVLTGPASARDLADLADVILPDIGHLPAWLDGTVPALDNA
ncbi:HAD family hydrolase [Pseudooceanicola sediminis]|uniref:phosphoglycolate phosphatase n=1 Tax=Pseudooceanicola sediminis TaxID=2211117 RepID=A0A399J1S2_9RHOB|nr:HAD family hydrolase [Pseudooceanicola sediminis]KAA2316320.1 HAD family hydrolase [Puniceibacterium sp. HSS470]RII39234.1 HAD family hydrolase [Pseudooceanicola sediminis]